MSADLISRAMERLAQRDRASLIERVGKKLEEETPAKSVSSSEESILGPQVSNPSPTSSIKSDRLHTKRQIAVQWASLQSSGIINPHSDTSRLTEEFRLIKRPLINKAFGEGDEYIERGNVFMVTSARSGEGKTFVALNLAISLASEHGLNVLLIDADFRNPSVLRRLGFNADYGFIDILKNTNLDFADVLLRTDLSNLTILPAGSATRETTEILASQRMESIVSELSQRYADRVIIFDTPPLLAASEPVVLAQLVGQILFVIESRSTGISTIQDALGLIENCSNISMILNKRQPTSRQEKLGSQYSSAPSSV